MTGNRALPRSLRSNRTTVPSLQFSYAARLSASSCNAESATIVARRQSHDALKHFSEGSCILITDHPGNLFDRQDRTFQRLACFANTQVLQISRRGHDSGLVESS